MSLKREMERKEKAESLYGMQKTALDAIQTLFQVKSQLIALATTAKDSSYFTQDDVDEIDSVIAGLKTELANKVVN